MNEGYKVGGIVLVLFMISVGMATGIMLAMNYKTDQENKIVIGEGIVSDMEIQNDGGFGSFTMYLISINGKDFEITKEQYYNINIRDYVIIYKGGKVIIVD